MSEVMCRYHSCSNHILCLMASLSLLICVGFKTWLQIFSPSPITKWSPCPLPLSRGGLLQSNSMRDTVCCRGYIIEATQHLPYSQEHWVPCENFKYPEAAVLERLPCWRGCHGWRGCHTGEATFRVSSPTSPSWAHVSSFLHRSTRHVNKNTILEVACPVPTVVVSGFWLFWAMAQMSHNRDKPPPAGPCLNPWLTEQNQMLVWCHYIRGS